MIISLINYNTIYNFSLDKHELCGRWIFELLCKFPVISYHIDHGLSRLTDRRVSPKYKTPQVILITLLAFQLRIKSMNELKYLLKENEFRSLFSSGTPMPCIDAIINTLKSVDVTGLKSILKGSGAKIFLLFSYFPISDKMISLLISERNIDVRNLQDMMLERGLKIAHTTNMRLGKINAKALISEYSPILSVKLRKHLKPTNDS